MEKLQLALTVLLTGLIVVFVMLLVLIIAIKIYSTIVYNAQNKKSKKLKSTNTSNDADLPEPALADASADYADEASDGISDEIIAVIAAAVSTMYADTGAKYTLKSVKRAKNVRPAWGTAGLIENTRPF